MAGKKYSTFYDTAFRTPEEMQKKSLLAKLFSSEENPFTSGKYDYAQVVAAAKKYLTALTAAEPNVQEGDPEFFPENVRFDYNASADVSSVKWTEAGDPATPYIPDLRSPGNPELIPGDSAPDIKGTDIKPNYTPAVGLPPKTTVDKGTYNPAVTGPAIHEGVSTSLDAALPLGHSTK
jgi:hypothetical protein